MSIPSPVYYSPVPASPSESGKVSQPKLTTNSTTIQTVYSWDHVPFGTAGFMGNNAGLHNQVSLTANNIPTPNPNANILYSTAFGSLQQLFMMYANGTSVQMPGAFTEFSSSGTGYTQNQVSWYVANLKFNFGLLVLTGGSISNATISYGVPYESQCLWCALMPGTMTANSAVNMVSAPPFPVGGFVCSYQTVIQGGQLCYLSVGF